MLYRCKEGCEEDIGMSRAREVHRCDKHGFTLSYVKPLGSRERAKPRRSTLKKGRGFAVHPKQREKVAGLPCINCGREAGGEWAIDPAHLWPRSLGGCDDPLCVGPLCRNVFNGEGCHPDLDSGKLELLPQLVSRGYWAEMAHAIEAHEVSPTVLVDRLTCPSEHSREVG